MMNIRSLTPPDALSAYVNGILVIEQDEPRSDFVLPLFANGMPTLVFRNDAAQSDSNRAGHLGIYGQTIAPGQLRLPERFVLIAYFLRPYVAKAITGLSATELTNAFIDLDELKAVRDIGLQEQLLEARSVAGRLQLINTFLWSRVAADRIDYSRIAFATDSLQRDQGEASLSRLREQLYSTERSLQRLFEEQIGVSPRVYKRICQFHAAFNELNKDQFAKLSDIAYQHGFFDQSHFVRVFKEFTGMTPKAYLALRSGYTAS
ncbi:helix-turn-helix domain-containing protein [Taibaiella koreensis]|uniref:helix-turn-helix domain-containing protein n=1 Tax=Taibaiella koreensis TaxID=1268548 RepID=UPI0013C2D5B7|nr:helix-turn-helix domain-containing protein [Taibaiella koreensis]